MKTIIGYTDSINECDCCGKTELKGTYCIDLDGVELYYGSVCAFKSHGLTTDEQKELKITFAKAQKNAKLIEMHIAPIKAKLAERLDNGFTTTYENLTDVAKKCYNTIKTDYQRVIEYTAKKYKIVL
jgi:hypothetical protein